MPTAPLCAQADTDSAPSSNSACARLENGLANRLARVSLHVSRGALFTAPGRGGPADRSAHLARAQVRDRWRRFWARRDFDKVVKEHQKITKRLSKEVRASATGQ